jgi:type I restriction enzyme, S subunit
VTELEGVMSTSGHMLLPKGWRAVTLDGVLGNGGIFVDGDWVESKDQDPDGDVRLIQLADVGDGEYRDRSARFLTSQKANELSCTFLEPGDLLIARMPDPLGRACVFPGDRKRAVTVVDVAVVRPNNPGVNVHWLMYRINAPLFRHAVASMQSGSTRQRVSRKNLSKITFALPPRDAQDETVTEIEKMFSRLKEAVDGLKRVKTNLARYKAGILTAAVRGGLVPTEADLARRERRTYESGLQLLQRVLYTRRSEWKGKSKYSDPPVPDTTRLPTLPEGWTWATYAQMGDVTTGSTPPTADSTNFGGEIPFMKPTDLDAGEHLVLAREYLSQKGLTKGRKIPSGSVLVTCIGATIGKTGLARVDCATNQQINALTLAPDGAIPAFAFLWTVCPAGQRQILDNASATTLPILNKSKFESLAFPVPPLAEQHRIVAEVERRFSLIRGIEVEIEANMQRSQALRQGVLRTRFRW